MDKLTRKELELLRWFVAHVQSWNSSGPFGDGEVITDKRGFNAMQRISRKLGN